MDNDDLHAIAIEAALAGARAIQDTKSEDFATQGKGGIEDYVTAADLASEQAIIRVVKERRSRDQIIAEETGIHPGTTNIVWYIDPLDGTANFLAGSPDYAVSISAHQADQVIAAVIYRPADDQWLATSASGEVQGTITPSLAPPRSLDLSRVTVSRPHDPVCSDEAMALRAALRPHVASEQRVGSAACALLYVVTGRLDAYISVDLPVWDTAAGHMLVERTCGAVIHMRGRGGTPLSVAGEPRTARNLTNLMLGC